MTQDQDQDQEIPIINSVALEDPDQLVETFKTETALMVISANFHTMKMAAIQEVNSAEIVESKFADNISRATVLMEITVNTCTKMNDRTI